MKLLSYRFYRNENTGKTYQLVELNSNDVVLSDGQHRVRETLDLFLAAVEDGTLVHLPHGPNSFQTIPKQGDKVVVVSGEFRGRILAVGRVWNAFGSLSIDMVDLQALDQRTLQWVDFCTVSLDEFHRLTRPL